jgi:hypothetical protein
MTAGPRAAPEVVLFRSRDSLLAGAAAAPGAGVSFAARHDRGIVQ